MQIALTTSHLLLIIITGLAYGTVVARLSLGLDTNKHQLFICSQANSNTACLY
jgi:hypothetical protein